MKIVLLLSFVALFISCKGESKKAEKDLVDVEDVVVTDKINYPKLEGVPQSLNYIFTEGYLYSEDIQIGDIATYKTGEDNYNFIIYLDNKTNMEQLKQLTLGLVIYPKDLSVLKTAKEKKTKSIGKGFSTEVYMLDDAPVVVAKDLKIETNEFNLLKVYFYSKEVGVLNDKILKISNFKL